MKYTWWLLQGAGILASLFFFVFGLDLLLGAYQMTDPFTFIMTFFAASFVLLISATLALSFLIKMIRVYRRIQNTL